MESPAFRRGEEVKTNVGPCVVIRVEHLLTRQDLIDALAWAYRNTSLGEELPALTNSQVRGAIRQTLLDDGAEDLLWSERCGDEIALGAWAAKHVDRVYGEDLAGALD